MIVEDEGHALVDSSNAAAAKKTRCRQRASDAWVVLPRRTKFIMPAADVLHGDKGYDTDLIRRWVEACLVPG